MVARARDWFRQAEGDLAHARDALATGHYDWACFASQQAAEKAVKALYQRSNGEARGHAVALLLVALREVLPPDHARRITPAVVQLAGELDKQYIPTRYPNAHPEGAPVDLYTRPEAERAIAAAGQVLHLCAELLADETAQR